MQPDGDLAQPAIEQPAVVQPVAMAQPDKVLAQPVFDNGCAVQAPEEYRQAMTKAAHRAFAWGSIAEGECWSIATAQAESQWDPKAVSPAQAAGIMQIVPATAQHLGLADPFDPVANIDAGVRYLNWCIRQWSKSAIPRKRTFREAAQIGSFCYNAGPARPLDTQRAVGCRYWDGCFDKHAPDETKTYVRRIEGLADTGEWR